MAANRQEIDLIVEAITKGFDNVIADMNKVERATDDAGDSAKDSGLKWTELKSGLDLAWGAFQKVAVVAQKAYTGLKEGADLNLAAAQFDNLAASIGTTSDSLLGKMQMATNGMVSNADLIASANELMTAKIARSEDAVVRLSSVSGQLNWDMGLLAQTINNQSTLRLDNLGLAVEDVIPRFNELRQTMSDKDAFALAVIEAGERQIELLGDASETTAGQLQQLEAEWANLTNSWKQAAATVAGPVVSGLLDQTRAIDALTIAYRNGDLTWGQWQAAQNQVRNLSTDNAQVLRDYGITIDGLTIAQEANILRAEAMNEHYGAQAEVLAEAEEALAAATAEAESHDQAMLQLAGTYNSAHTSAINVSGALNTVDVMLLRAEQSTLRADQAAKVASGGFSTLYGDFQTLTTQVDRASLALEKVYGQLVSLDGRRATAEVVVNVTGADAAQRIENLMNGGGGGQKGAASGGSKTAEGAASYSGSTVVQNNTFNNAADPNAIATQTAEQIGKVR